MFGHKLSFPALAVARAALRAGGGADRADRADDAGAAEAIDLSPGNAYLPGTVAAAAVAFFSRHTLAAIVSGFVVYGLWRWLL